MYSPACTNTVTQWVFSLTLQAPSISKGCILLHLLSWRHDSNDWYLTILAGLSLPIQPLSTLWVYHRNYNETSQVDRWLWTITTKDQVGSWAFWRVDVGVLVRTVLEEAIGTPNKSNACLKLLVSTSNFNIFQRSHIAHTLCSCNCTYVFL